MWDRKLDSVVSFSAPSLWSPSHLSWMFMTLTLWREQASSVQWPCVWVCLVSPGDQYILPLGMFALITGLKWHLLGCSGMNHYFSLCNSPLSFKHTHLALLCKQYILRISVHCFLERESCHTSKENSFLLFFFYMCVSPILWMYHDLLNSLNGWWWWFSL